MTQKVPADVTLSEIQALHDRATDEVAYLQSSAKTCGKCESALVPDSVFCHRCGVRIPVASSEATSAPVDSMTIKLHGLYDDSRREELSLAMIPILADLSRTIDMANVEHIDVAALMSLVPLLEARQSESKPPIDVLGMNDDVHKSLTRANFAKYFNRLEAT
jgi:anti-anti-sigma regulatory factor